MSYRVATIEVFERQAKRLLKKYPSLKRELPAIVGELKEHPDMGISLGNNCYKIRISIASKGKGKSGGARLITNFTIYDNTVYLLSIYDKSEKETLTDKELEALLSHLP